MILKRPAKNSHPFSFDSHIYDQDVYFKLSNDRILFLKEDINARVATDLVANLIWMNAVDPNQDITLCINSPGGSINDGLLAIYDTIQFIQAPVSTICIGEACSGAAVILAAGSPGKRFAYSNSEIMIHGVQIYSEINGPHHELEKESRRLRKLNTSLMEIIAKHTGQTLEKIKEDCLEDKYFTAKEAIEYGLIDAVIKPAKKIPQLVRDKKSKKA